MWRLLCLTPERDASFLHRFHWPLSSLRKEEAQILETTQPVLARAYLNDVDALLLMRYAGADIEDLVVEAKRRGIHIIYDLDDHILGIQPDNPAYLMWGIQPNLIQAHLNILRQNPAAFPAGGSSLHLSTEQIAARNRDNRHSLVRLLRQADVITCSTEEVAAVYSRFGRVTLLPNGVEDYGDRVPERSSDRVLIGFQGVASHYADLAMIAQALALVLAREENAYVKVVGLPYVEGRLFPDKVRGRINSHPWLPREEWEREVLGFDICLAPLTETAFNRCKSALRVLLGWSMGQAVVASPVGEQAALIEETGGGLLAKTMHDWAKALTKLVRDEGMRISLSAIGKQHVLANRLHGHISQRWREILGYAIGPASEAGLKSGVREAQPS